MRIDVLESVETFLTSLHEREVAKVIRTIELLEEFGNNLGMPQSKHLSDGLLELRGASFIYLVTWTRFPLIP